jgi:hypothetical protein
MALVNIDTEKLAHTIVTEAAQALPEILEKFTQDLEARVGDLLRNRTITIQIHLGDSTK